MTPSFKQLVVVDIVIVLVALVMFAFALPGKTIDIPVAPAIEIQKPTPTLNPALARICSCESTGRPGNKPRHYDSDGNVLRGVVNRDDVGMCQINLHYHEESAKKLGLNLFTEEGNIEFANHLYATQGSTPWNWSKSCWQK